MTGLRAYGIMKGNQEGERLVHHHFFAYMARLKHIRRWNMRRNSFEEDVAQHSLQVSMIAYALAAYKNARFGGGANPDRAAALATFHEAPEVITGDIATPIKYFSPEIRASFGHIEELSAQKLHSLIPEDLRPALAPMLISPERDPEWQRVKAADTIAAYIHCIEEIKAGNSEFEKVAKQIHQKILDRYDLPEVHAFLQECLPSYELTLEELY